MTTTSSQLLVLRELVKRDFQARYAGSLLGFLWSFVQPLWQLVLFSFVFSSVLKVTPTGERTGSFAVFLFCGLLPWLAVNEGVSRAATSITDNANLVKKLRFRSEVLVLAAVLTALVHEAIAAAVFMTILAARGQLAWGGLPLLAVALPLQFLLTAGLGLLLAGLHVFVRDIGQALGMVFSGWFYLTPIVYPLAYVPERFRAWISVNPLTALVTLYRQALLGGGWDLPPGTATLAVLALALMGAGGFVFRRLQPAFVDEI